MDHFLEILIPLIFAAIYFFGNMFSGKDKDDSGPAQAPHHRSEDTEPDAIERQRRIQEEIRRKIMDRRRQAPGGSPTESVETPAPARPQASEVGPRTVSRKAPEQSGFPSPVSQPSNLYESQMQARLQQIEVTKRQAEKLRQQAAMVGMPAPGHPEATWKRTSLFRGSVRAGLKDPVVARAAFVYAEVLGQPVSQRKSSTVPGLSV